MTKNKIEIVPYTDQDSQGRELKRVLTHLVEEKLAEATGGPTAIFQPFFSTKLMMTEIRKQQSVAEQNKFAYSFDKWGCLAGCGATKATTAHGSLGMCSRCYRLWSQRLREIVREHTPTNHEDQGFIDTVNLARAAFDPSNRMLGPAPSQAEKGKLYTQREAAAAAGIHPKTLYLWLRDGEVRPSVQASEKRFLWTDADIEELKLLKNKNASHHGSKASKARWAKPGSREQVKS